jgi:surface polysaccharide O-acyltransferase-like enzyme
MRSLQIDGRLAAEAADAHERTLTTTRLAYVDTLRVLLTALVVAHHAGQAYGPTGGDWPIFEGQRAAILGPFFSVNAAFFMGLFFLLAGYFLPSSYDRKGARSFASDRLLRLGVPLLISTLIFGALFYLSENRQISFPQYFFQIYIGERQIEFAHLWFVAHLLVYSLAYAVWRLATQHAPVAERFARWVPGHGAILAYTVALALATFIVRVWYPIDRWEPAFGIIPAEYAHVPQYFSLFLLGIAAGRYDWLRRISAATGMIWLGVGLAAAGLRYGYPFIRQLGLPLLIEGGGLNWRSLVWSSWEALICVGLCIGLPVLFREHFTRQGALLRWLSSNVYATYIVHIWPIVGLQFALAHVALPPLLKFAIVTLVGIPLSFLIGALLRRLPYATKIL